MRGMWAGLAVCAGVIVIGASFGQTPSVNPITDPNDPHYLSSATWGQAYDDQWALKRIGFIARGSGTSAWERAGAELKAVVVAVIDTGLDLFHPDLRPENVWRNPKEVLNGRDDDGNGYVDDAIGWNFFDNTNDPIDRVGHGTHVAGVIAAAIDNGEGIAGMNPLVKIMPLKVLDPLGRTRSLRVAQAIIYAVDNGARIINLSLGGEGVSRVERAALEHARKKNVVVVVAAGNSGRDVAVHGLTGIPNLITVAATDTFDQRASTSNWGQAIDISAPGVDILSLRARRTDLQKVANVQGYQAGSAFVGRGARYYRASGTSFAAAFVSGAASLLLSKNPNLTNEEVKRILIMSADDVETPGWDQYTGYGRLNVAAALEADPKFFLDARITGVDAVPKAGSSFIRLRGSVNADWLGKAWVEIGAGDDPLHWKRASRDLTQVIRDGTLVDIPSYLFVGSRLWTFRLNVEHANGRRREARFRLTLTTPTSRAEGQKQVEAAAK